MDRRDFIKLLAAGGGAAGLPSLAGCAGWWSRESIGPVVVIGGGFAGATAAKYIRMWEPRIEVTLIERRSEFVSCALSNLVVGGSRQIAELTTGYGVLARRYGVKVVRDEVVALDPVKRELKLASGGTLGWQRAIVAPGVDFMYEALPGLDNPQAQGSILHAWKAGGQTVALRRQLEAMPDGGVYVLCIPRQPYRCPPAPYERVCQVAGYFQRSKPRSKVLVLDANPDIVANKALFTAAWSERYRGLVEYHPDSELLDVDAKTLTAKLRTGEVRADVLNVIPPQKAGRIAHQAGLVTADRRWCGVDFLSYESLAHRNVHVLGDAVLSPAGMPKSGQGANQQGKLCADAVVALMTGRVLNDEPTIASTCYSFVSTHDAASTASVYRYDREKRTMVAAEAIEVPSAAPAELEGELAVAWGRNLWADMLL